ncbi:hypothetical protein WAE58_22235 [Pedobacter panaciterrae]|uniref:Uncharacterized protein n=1 Tax=Pedobacter panaciterrae TaxID=363849 RepID=A0ABU8NSU0_9SPHI
MIELITRKLVFDTYKIITSKIVEIQKSMLDDDPLFEDGDDGKWYMEMHDAIDIPPHDIRSYYSIISFDHTDITTFTIALSEKLTSLLIKLNVSDLIVISDLKLSFVGNSDNKYPPFQKATQKFNAITKDLEYDEAFKISLIDLPTFIEIIFWIERCDARAPEFIYFCDADEKIAFYLCKSGSIHIIEYANKILSDDLIESLEMHLINGYCEEKFSSSSKIEGRISSRSV